MRIHSSFPFIEKIWCSKSRDGGLICHSPLFSLLSHKVLAGFTS
jgi:hypothetical protein